MLLRPLSSVALTDLPPAMQREIAEQQQQQQQTKVERRKKMKRTAAAASQSHNAPALNLT